MYAQQKLLIANRGEIATRIIRTAQRLGIPTVAVYAKCDATSPHVVLADEAVLLRPQDDDPASNARGYLDMNEITRVCVEHNITLVHPGYGFLSENADFVSMLEAKGVSWVGPRPEIVRTMGLKHEARELAKLAGVPIVPGSQDAVLADSNEAANVAGAIGYPVMLKATAGGGGMGLVVCADEKELRDKFETMTARATSLFHDGGMFIERYFPYSRHIEVQVFGNGRGRVIHMGERECSIQRRYQKLVEESPSPFMAARPALREKMCKAALELCDSIYYNSAGTVEFLVDDLTSDFYFLEMNTRIQVEHTVTEAVCPSLDIVELMLLQAVAERTSSSGLSSERLSAIQQHFASTPPNLWAMQVRVYCENPSMNFKPSPGVLQYVSLPHPPPDWLRIDSWIETGTSVTPFYDPLVAKLIVKGSSREETLQRMSTTLQDVAIWGPPNNLSYLHAICNHDSFIQGKATTSFLNGLEFVPRALDVLSGGLETSIQDFPGRKMGLGVPRSGPMDSLALRAANIIVGNSDGTEALEITLPAVPLRMFFHVAAVICVAGSPAKVSINRQDVTMWTKLVVPAKSNVTVSAPNSNAGQGFRTYLAVRGGFPEVPEYLGSKSTSMGLGGYQGRPIAAGDQLVLGDCAPNPTDTPFRLPLSLTPSYPQENWTIHCLAGPHCDAEFVTLPGIESFFATKWKVSASSNRMGIRLEGSKVDWARSNGGEGGSHPSNIHDNGYALGTINVNGDTPVILGNEGPDMGGYLCLCTITSADLWKVGQLRPGATVQFKRICFNTARQFAASQLKYLDLVRVAVSSSVEHNIDGMSYLNTVHDDGPQDPKLHVVKSADRPKAIFRQAGDAAILVEFGDLKLDFHMRVRIHAFETQIRARSPAGIWALSPCIRSTMVHYDPEVVSQSKVLALLIEVEQSLPSSMHDASFDGRKITFPIVLDDSWNREALQRYSRSIRDEAVYLPSNIEYLAKNNGLKGGAEEALRLLVNTNWLVFGVGFYLACPFLVPIDPRCRLVSQKMNPSRTYTPRGAIGIAGLVAAIYPIESPGGYQLYGRTLPPWQTWGRGYDFSPNQPWLLRPFDQIAFEVITEAEYVRTETQFDAGHHRFKIEPVRFSMLEYDDFVDSIKDEVDLFKKRQAAGVAAEEAREAVLLRQWEQRCQAEREAKKTTTLNANSTAVGSELWHSTVVSSMSASVWKIQHGTGYVVKAADDVLVVLEAMKTEINVEAGEENVGRTVQGFGEGIRVGSIVSPGQILVYLV